MNEVSQAPPSAAPPQVKEPLMVGSIATSVKLWSQDYDDLNELKTKVAKVLRSITIVELVREAVHAGLPHIAAKYKSITDITHDN